MCIWTLKWIHRKVYLRVKVCHWPSLVCTIHPLCGSTLSIPVLKSLCSVLPCIPAHFLNGKIFLSFHFKTVISVLVSETRAAADGLNEQNLWLKDH